MEESEGDLFNHSEAILPVLHHHQMTTKNVLQDLRTLVALNDPEDRILFQTPDGSKQFRELENIVG